MSDEALVERLRSGVATYDDMADAADRIEAQDAEIARLRALCGSQSKDLSLSAMRHGRILVGLERRNRRQRRALATLYQRRHDKNAEITRLRAKLDTARREGMEEVRAIFNDAIENTPLEGTLLMRQIDAAIHAAAKEDRPSEEIIREDRDAWPDHHADDAIRAAAKEGE